MQVIKNNDLSIININNKFANFLLIVFAIIGVLLSIELTIIYYNVNFIPEATPSFCAVNEIINCDAVAKTEYSHFLGLPLSVYGLIFYSIILLLSLASSFKDHAFFKQIKNPTSYIFSLTSISLFTSVFLAWLSSTQIHKICILCYATYFINIFIFILSKPGASILKHYKNTVENIINILSKPIYRVILAILVVLTGGCLYYFNKSEIFLPEKPVTNNHLLPLNNFPINFNPLSVPLIYKGNILGAKNSKLIIHEYTDFECPFCSISNAMMHKLVQEVKGVQVIHHDFPLSSECNKFIKFNFHKNSCKASLYSLAVKKQGKYWEFNTLLFRNQEDLSEDKILEIAKNLKLNINKLKKDVNSPDLKAELKKNIEAGNKFEITGTPTYIIGFKKYEGLMPYPELKQKVLESLK
ncbi:MAG: vitamin K epoxide reductase family protein [bacterium]